VWQKALVSAAVAIFLAVFSDWIDGIIARKTGSVSDWGKIFDPLADKVAIGAFIVTLTFVGAVPLWFVVLFLLRDGLIAAGGIIMTRRTGSPPSSNVWGKYSSLTISVYLTVAAVSHMTGSAVWPEGMLLAGLDPVGILALGFVLLSLFVYFSEFVEHLRKA
jgi:CDP-diacylglycerol--glycerol-3-phosphate 3-phosphatidyltransferase